jgi:histone-lysine N-methyltransferase SETMAR
MRAHNINILQQLNWKVLEHPAHSPDLAPSDFHLFGPFKNALRCCRFADDDGVKEAVHDWLRKQPQNFFHMALGSLQTTGLNVLRSKEIVLKSNVFVMSLT